MTFRPPRWLESPHLQTIGAALPLHVSARRHPRASEAMRFPIADLGGFVHARAWWTEGRAPAVVIIHGIAGSKDSHCCVRAALALHRAGYHAVRLDMRSAGESVIDAPLLYHAGLTTDLDTVVRTLGEDPRVSDVLVLGFSGGGSQALKLAGEWGASPPPCVRGIVTASAPLDYTRVSVNMDGPSALVYRYYVLRGLLDRARRFAEHHPHLARYRVADLATIKRFRAFDESIIVPMYGFADVDAYYREASAGRLLSRIEVPSLVLHAEDDPMVRIETIRPSLENASSFVRPNVSDYGGHLGWVGGIDAESLTNGWIVEQALAFFAEVRSRREPRAIESAVA